jgi:DNA-binding transcriptional LysR family regulator
MARPDLNLLYVLDAVLSEGSVARAARRMRLSPSAMSRALTRLRETVGDPLLVRAGRGLVPTPRALELRQRVAAVAEEAEAVLRPVAGLDLTRLLRTFTVRTSDGFAENFGAELLARVAREAPGVRLRFVPKTSRDGSGLRDGSVDLQTGVVGENTNPELRTQLLFRDGFIAVVREGHPLARNPAPSACYAAGRHILTSRRGSSSGPVDEALKPLGVKRDIRAVVSGFATALALARGSDLIATVPDRHTRTLRAGMHAFPLPVETPELAICLLWHPRLHADPGHRWLRECVRETCKGEPAGS